MNETKSYKNINANDLDLRARISVTAKKAAFLVPKLLGKMMKALVLNPVTKLVSGQTYEHVKAEAIRGALEDQKEKADELGVKIEEGRANLEDWKNDEEYYTSNIAKYKAYESTIERLEKKQNKLLTVPKKILVAKNYLMAMKAFKKHRKQQKANEKLAKKVVEEYKRRQEEIAQKELEVEALRQALRESELSLQTLKDETKEFEKENAAVISEAAKEETTVTEVEAPTEDVKVEEPAQPEVQNVELEADELSEQELDNVVAGVAVPAEEVKAEEPAQPEVQNVDPEAPEATEIPESTRDEIVASFVAPNAGVKVEEPVQPVMPTIEPRPSSLDDLSVEMEAPAFEADPREQEFFNHMANLAAIGQVPASSLPVLESYGLTQEETQKKL